jgi:outer membrane protein TolC
MSKSIAAIRNAESRQRKQKRGLIRTEVQVFEEDRDAVHEYAAILRAKKIQQQNTRES